MHDSRLRCQEISLDKPNESRYRVDMVKKKGRKKSAINQAMSDYFATLGAKGGKIGGKNRWAGISAEDRSNQMREMALAREKAKRKALPQDVV